MSRNHFHISIFNKCNILNDLIFQFKTHPDFTKRRQTNHLIARQIAAELAQNQLRLLSLAWRGPDKNLDTNVHIQHSKYNWDHAMIKCTHVAEP